MMGQTKAPYSPASCSHWHFVAYRKRIQELGRMYVTLSMIFSFGDKGLRHCNQTVVFNSRDFSSMNALSDFSL